MSTGIYRSTRQPVNVRAWAAQLGMVEVTGVPATPPKVGDQALVYGRGDWRLGTITKVGRTTIYVAVSTPTSPDLITTARIGGRWQERGYLKEVSA